MRMEYLLCASPALLSIAFYVLYVLLPMVPSVTIYRLFPSTTVAVSGPLSGLTVRATGAFAAYVITVVLGWSLVSATQDLIRGMERVTWKVTGDVQLADSSERPIEGATRESLVRALQVTLVPPYYQPVDKTVVVRTPLDEETPPTLTYSIPQFGDVSIVPSRDNAKWNYGTHEVVFREPIRIRAWSEPSVTASTERYLKPD